MTFLYQNDIVALKAFIHTLRVNPEEYEKGIKNGCEGENIIKIDQPVHDIPVSGFTYIVITPLNHNYKNTN